LQELQSSDTQAATLPKTAYRMPPNAHSHLHNWSQSNEKKMKPAYPKQKWGERIHSFAPIFLPIQQIFTR
jgi:hypothetical protein